MGLSGFDVDAVLDRFGLRPQGRGVELGGGEDNLNVRVATDGGDVVVRRYDVSGFEKVAAELRLVEYLAGRGYPTPAPLSTADGDRFVRWRDRPVAVFPFVAGTTPGAGDRGISRTMGGLLGRLHALADQWRDPAIPEVDRLAIVQTPGLAQGLPDEAAWEQARRGFADQWGAKLERALPRLPQGPLHHDLHPGNLVMAGRRPAAVLDFDELNCGPLAIDVVRTWHYLASRRRLPEQRRRAVVAGYEQHRLLTGDERALLPVLFDLVNLVDAALFLSAARDEIGAVAECDSFATFLANRV